MTRIFSLFVSLHSPRSKKAFTLVELLVVMSIISFLSSSVISSTNSVRTKARDTERLSQINQISKALAVYYNANGSFPDRAPYNNLSIPQAWQDMVGDLNSGGYIKATFTMTDPATNPFSFFVKTAYASGLGPTYYPCSIQDPLYKVAEDYGVSFGYSTNNNGASYILRTKLENTSHSALNSSQTGDFYQVGVPTGTEACDKTLGYYCKGN